MRNLTPSIALRAMLCIAVTPLLGCPQIVFGIPASFRSPPRFAAPESIATDAEFVRVDLDFEPSEFLLFYRLRVDDHALEPTLGGCRGHGLPRVARKSAEAREKFCHKDFVRLYLEAGADHTLEFKFESQHEVAERRRLEPGRNMRWIMPIHTQRIELTLSLEPGHAYVIRAEEKDMTPREALGENAPPETSRDLEQYEPLFNSGIEVGTINMRVVRVHDGEIVRTLTAPIYSGKMNCDGRFCEPD